MKSYFPKIPVVVYVLFAAAIAILLFVDLVPPRAHTTGAMYVARLRILAHAEEHGRLPETLAETKPLERKIDRLVDGWDRPLLYTIDEHGVVTLRSLGEDGLEGGSKANTDVAGRFATKDPDGSWAKPEGGWLDVPEVVEEKPKQGAPAGA